MSSPTSNLSPETRILALKIVSRATNLFQYHGSSSRNLISAAEQVGRYIETGEIP